MIHNNRLALSDCLSFRYDYDFLSRTMNVRVVPYFKMCLYLLNTCIINKTLEYGNSILPQNVISGSHAARIEPDNNVDWLL